MASRCPCGEKAIRDNLSATVQYRNRGGAPGAPPLRLPSPNTQHPTIYLYPHRLSTHLSSSHHSLLRSSSSLSQIPMNQTSFQDLFNAALQDYENQTGTSLINHPFSEQLEACDSVDSITAILQEQAQIFRKFKGDDGKLMKSLNCSVDVLYTLSTTILGEGIGVVRQKTFISVPCF